MELCAACGGEILEDIGGNFRCDKEVTASLIHADVSYGLPADACPHQRPEEIPVVGAVSLIKDCPQADTGAVLVKKGGFFQIFWQIHQHFSLRVGIAAKGVKTLRFSEKEFCHFQLPGGEKTGVGGNVFPDSCVDLVP